MDRAIVAAVDLGATSGRVIVGRVDQGEIRMRHVHRFTNDPLRLRDGLHWNAFELYKQVLTGLATAERESPGQLESIGIDSWAVDYGLMSGSRVLGLPFHYRDERTTEGVEKTHAQVPFAELYARNGLQFLPFNTLYQLAMEGSVLDAADRMLLIPDLFAYWMTGAISAERSNASTTGLYDPQTHEWDSELATRLGINPSILPPLIDAGVPLGSLVPEAAEVVGRSIPVVSVGSHDTASAVVAVPNPGRDFAYISCGTWGLVGQELDRPVLTDQAREANFTNEGGVGGRIRFLRNVMGLWLLSESIRGWEKGSSSNQQSSLLQTLLAQAAEVEGPIPLFDVDDPRFMPPGDIPARIADWCREHGVPAPEGRPAIVRSIIESMGQAFADTVHKASAISGQPVSVIHLIGGGAQNALLCQATADRSGLPVIAGPVEATAIGNILVQAQALGRVPSDLESLRSLVARSFTFSRYEPRG